MKNGGKLSEKPGEESVGVGPAKGNASDTTGEAREQTASAEAETQGGKSGIAGVPGEGKSPVMKCVECKAVKGEKQIAAVEAVKSGEINAVVEASKSEVDSSKAREFSRRRTERMKTWLWRKRQRARLKLG